MENETKVYSRRDSATACLKKLGIDKANYNRFIVAHHDEQGDLFEVNITAAQASLNKPSSAKRATVSPPPVGINKFKKAVAVLDAQPVPTKDRMVATKDGLLSNKRTISHVARLLIKQGKTNAEVWETLKKEFSLSDNKKHYPAWYRAELNRKGG